MLQVADALPASCLRPDRGLPAHQQVEHGVCCNWHTHPPHTWFWGDTDTHTSPAASTRRLCLLPGSSCQHGEPHLPHSHWSADVTRLGCLHPHLMLVSNLKSAQAPRHHHLIATALTPARDSKWGGTGRAITEFKEKTGTELGQTNLLTGHDLHTDGLSYRQPCSPLTSLLFSIPFPYMIPSKFCIVPLTLPSNMPNPWVLVSLFLWVTKSRLFLSKAVPGVSQWPVNCWLETFNPWHCLCCPLPIIFVSLCHLVYHFLLCLFFPLHWRRPWWDHLYEAYALSFCICL